MRNAKGYTLVEMLFTLFVIVGGLGGWILNLAQVVRMAIADELTTMFIIKVVGLFIAPVGAVLGWIGLF